MENDDSQGSEWTCPEPVVCGPAQTSGGFPDSPLPRVWLEHHGGICVDVCVCVCVCVGVRDAHRTGSENTFLALEARWELALGLGHGEFAGSGKGHQIQTLFLRACQGTPALLCSTLNNLELSRKSLTLPLPSWQRLIGSDLR